MNEADRANHMPSDADDGSPLAALVGPFYDHAGAANVLHVDSEELSRLAQAGRVLRLTTGDGTRVYPTRQFTRSGGTIPHLADVLDVLSAGDADPWAQALWLSSAADGKWEGLCAWEWLASGRDPAVVLVEARRDAARWRT